MRRGKEIVNLKEFSSQLEQEEKPLMGKQRWSSLGRSLSSKDDGIIIIYYDHMEDT